MLLDWLSRRRNDQRLATAAGLIERAVETVLDNPETRTRDLGGGLDSRTFTAKIVGEIHKDGQAHTVATDIRIPARAEPDVCRRSGRRQPVIGRQDRTH